MRQSGLDDLLIDRLDDDKFTYAGYSAGSCVVALTLRGIHLADFPNDVPQGYSPEVIWDDLGFVPFAIAPHYKSDHPESEVIQELVNYFIEHKIPFIALHDGEAYVGEVKRQGPAQGKVI